MAISGSAFHYLTNSGARSTPYGGVIPCPIELGVSYPIIDGKKETVTATSGELLYLVVNPGDYPNTAGIVCSDE